MTTKKRTTKDTDPNDIINRATFIISEIMENSETDEPISLIRVRLEAASILLRVYSKNKKFEEQSNLPKQLNLEIGKQTLLDIYGITMPNT